MVGLDHHSTPSDEPEGEATASRNSRLGLFLFVLYSAFYLGYVLLTAFYRSLMDAVFVAGINLAIVYGLALILLAFILSLIYGWACRSPVSTSDSKETTT